MKKRNLALLLSFSLLFGACVKSPQKDTTEQAEKKEIIQQEHISEKEVTALVMSGADVGAWDGWKDYIIKETEISLVMVGDVLLHEPVSESGKLADGTYNYDHLFSKVKNQIQEADLALVNQEVILGGTELGLSGYPAFNGAYEVGDALVDAGFDVVLHGTNHALDKGKRGIKNCLNYWRTKHSDIAVLGIYDNQADYDNNTYIYEKDGVKIAILNYTYGTNGIKVPSDMPFAISYLNESKVKADLARAKEVADFTVVCPHWGTEYRHSPSAEQKKWSKIFIDGGADLVIGTHPHVIQPVEWVENANGEKMLVYYSLGNFINATSGSGAGTSDRMVGAMAKVTLRRDNEGEVSIKEYDAIPLVTHLRYGEKEITTYRLSDYTEELAAENETIHKDSAFSLEYCEKLYGQVFKELYQK